MNSYCKTFLVIFFLILISCNFYFFTTTYYSNPTIQTITENSISFDSTDFFDTYVEPVHFFHSSNSYLHHFLFQGRFLNHLLLVRNMVFDFFLFSNKFSTMFNKIINLIPCFGIIFFVQALLSRINFSVGLYFLYINLVLNRMGIIKMNDTNKNIFFVLFRCVIHWYFVKYIYSTYHNVFALSKHFSFFNRSFFKGGVKYES